MTHLDPHTRSEKARLARWPRRLGLAALALVPALSAAAGASASGATSIASAPLIQSGIKQTGNTQTDVTSPDAGVGLSSGCWNDLEYWRVPLTVGDDVVIDGGAVSPGDNLEIAVFPPGTTSKNIAGAVAVKYGLPLSKELHFTATATGTYPVVAGPTCYDGTDGPFSFTFTIKHGSGGVKATVALPHLSQLSADGTVTATVRAADGSPITNPQLVLELYGTWKDTATSPAKAHLLATASPTDGSVKFVVHLPKTVSGSSVQLHVTGSGAGYQHVSSRALKVSIS